MRLGRRRGRRGSRLSGPNGVAPFPVPATVVLHSVIILGRHQGLRLLVARRLPVTIRQVFGQCAFRRELISGTSVVILFSAAFLE